MRSAQPVMAQPAMAQSAGIWTLLPRHGARPLGFHGKLLLDASNRDAGLFAWSEIAVYQPAHVGAAPSGYVVAVRHRTAERALPLWQDAVACADAAAVHGFLRGHDPAAVMPLGIVADAAGLAGADALLAAVQDAIARQRSGWQALLARLFVPPPRLLTQETTP